MSFTKPLFDCKTFRIILSGFLAGFFPLASLYAEKPGLVFLSGQTTFFCEHEYTLQWTMDGPPKEPLRAPVLSIFFADRPVIRVPLTISGDRWSATFTFPHINDYTVIKTRAVILGRKESGEWLRLYQESFLFFSGKQSPDLLPAGSGRKIGIMDRSESKALTGFTKSSGIPAIRASSIHELEKGLLLCSGLTSRELSALFEEWISGNKNGVSVFICSPLYGSFILPGFHPGIQWLMGDETRAAVFDTRINLRSCQPLSDCREVTFRLLPDRMQIRLESSSEGEGYSWVEWNTRSETFIIYSGDLFQTAGENPSVQLLIRSLTKKKVNGGES